MMSTNDIFTVLSMKKITLGTWYWTVNNAVKSRSLIETANVTKINI